MLFVVLLFAFTWVAGFIFGWYVRGCRGQKKPATHGELKVHKDE